MRLLQCSAEPALNHEPVSAAASSGEECGRRTEFEASKTQLVGLQFSAEPALNHEPLDAAGSNRGKCGGMMTFEAWELQLVRLLHCSLQSLHSIMKRLLWLVETR